MTIPCAVLAMAHDREDVQAIVDAATDISRHQIERGRAPLWWEDDAVYAREEQTTLPGVERIQTAEELHAMGRGDCDDHAPTLAASLQVCGVDAWAHVVESPGIGYHVIVEYARPDGSVGRLDPSAMRGMLDVGAREDRRRLLRQRIAQSVRHAERLANAAAAAHPGTRAARALEDEARRALDRAAGARRRLEQLEQPAEREELDEDLDEDLEGLPAVADHAQRVERVRRMREVSGDVVRGEVRADWSGSHAHVRFHVERGFDDGEDLDEDLDEEFE